MLESTPQQTHNICLTIKGSSLSDKCSFTSTQHKTEHYWSI